MEDFDDQIIPRWRRNHNAPQNWAARLGSGELSLKTLMKTFQKFPSAYQIQIFAGEWKILCHLSKPFGQKIDSPEIDRMATNNHRRLSAIGRQKNLREIGNLCLDPLPWLGIHLP